MDKNLAKEERTLVQGIFYYIGIILNYKVMIIIISIIGTLAGLAFSIASLKLPAEYNPLPNTYMASAVLVLDQPDNSGAYSLLDSFGMQGGGVNNFNMIVQNVITSRNFVNSVADDLNLKELDRFELSTYLDLRRFLLGNLNYRYNEDTGALTFSFVDISPELARDVLNTFISQLERWYQEEGGSRSAQQLQSMEKSLNEINSRITSLQADILDFQQTYGFLTIADLARAQNDNINQLRGDLMNIELQLKNFSSFSRFEDPEQIRLRTERDNLLEMIRQIENGISSGIKIYPKKSELPALSLQLTKKTVDLQIQERLYAVISENYEVARLAAVSEQPFFVLQEAITPEEKYGPRRSMICLGAAAGSFFGSIFLALVLHLFRSIFSNPELIRLLKGKK